MVTFRSWKLKLETVDSRAVKPKRKDDIDSAFPTS